MTHLHNFMKNHEKAALVAGTDFMFTNPVARLGIPSLSMADGPFGLRKQMGKSDNGTGQSEPATAFPAAVMTACGWDPELMFKMGEAISRECRFYGVNILLGPGVNIQKNPLCGRNFEYFSEDPLLAGEIASGEVRGIRSQGTGVSVKHFALNNSENYRFMGDSIADMRAIYDIYLKPFELTVKKASPETLMCAYNKINGEYCSENKWLLTDVLRGEWNYDGVVMTDWGAVHNRVKGIISGLDLEMPGDTAICRRRIVEAVKNSSLNLSELDGCVLKILQLIEKLSDKPKAESADFEAHHLLCADIAAECAVLMKNDGILPLCKDGEVFVCGELFEKMRYQGSGSSMIHSTEVTSPADAFKAFGIRYRYEKGYRLVNKHTDTALTEQAVKNADGTGCVLVFAGLTDLTESEGSDRENMRLPDNQLELINALLDSGKRVIVVLFGGAPVELPFAHRVSAILNMFLPGQNGGSAVTKLLFGDRNPCGKLAQSWVRAYEDIPFSDGFGKTPQEIYKESVYVGYRYFKTAKKPVAFPFGFGLSYTSFEYGNMSVTETDSGIDVSCTVRNTGKTDGAEIVQLYVAAPKTENFKPEIELRAFCKVFVKVGECKTAKMHFEKDDLRFYHIREKRRVLESGEYRILICSDSENVRLESRVSIKGDENISMAYDKEVSDIYANADLSKVTNEIFERMSGLTIPTLAEESEVTTETRFSELNRGFFGRLLYGIVVFVVNIRKRFDEMAPEGVKRDNMIKAAAFLERVLVSNSLHSMSMSAGKWFPYNIAQGFTSLINGKILCGIKHICTGIKAPKLPKKN